MSWSVRIIINESSRKKVLKLLDEAVDEIKTEEEVFFDGDIYDGRLPRLKYGSYKGI